MHGIQKRSRAPRLALAASALLLLVGNSIQAAPFVEVTYDLGDTTATLTSFFPLFVEAGGPIETPLPSEHVAGMLAIRYSSDSASGVIDGPASLVSFHLTVTGRIYTNTESLVALATLTLRLRLENAPRSGGTLISAAVSFPGGTGLIQLTGQSHCFALCVAIGVTASVLTPIQTTTAAQPLPALLTSNGAATVAGTASMGFSLDPGGPSTSTYQVFPIALQMNLVGREISRRPVPEPGALSLLGIGLGGIALAGGAGGWMAKRRRGGSVRKV